MATKSAAKKVKSAASIVIPMTVLRDTKNTRRYEADDEDAPITSLYIDKSASTPDAITVTVSF